MSSTVMEAKPSDGVTAHPAYLQISTSEIKFRRDPAARQSLRSTIAKALRRKSPTLSRENATLSANVLVPMIKGTKSLYTEAAPKDRQRVAEEFQQVMALYFDGKFGDYSSTLFP